MALSWVSVDARTGLIGQDLPDLNSGGPVQLTLGAYEQLNATIPLPADVISYSTGDPKVPVLPAGQLADWRAATRPGQAVLIALDEDSNPIWGGLVITRTTDQTSQATLNLVTMEGYCDRRYCGTANFTNVGQNTIVASIIDSFILDGTLPGIPIRVQFLDDVGTVRTRALADSDDKTVYSVLQDMMSVDGGTEWTIGWERQHAPERITPVLFVGARVGTPRTPGQGTAATFSLPGPVQTATLVEDYSTGKGANRITATTGQGAGRLQATQQLGNFDGRLTFDYRWSPSSSITTTATLIAHAQRALNIIGGGTKAVTLTCNIVDAPPLGDEWALGDDVGYDLMSAAWADGMLRNGVGRVIGWQRDDNTVSPILQLADVSDA